MAPQDDTSLLRELAHELRDALSPIRAAIELMRMRSFDVEATRAMAERIERGLESALSRIDAFVLAEGLERGAERLEPVRVPLAELVQRVRNSLESPLRERCTFAAHEPIAVEADVARSVRALVAMLENAAAFAAPGSSLESRALAADGSPEIRVGFVPDPATRIGESVFETFRVRGSESGLALRAARAMLRLQGGDLRLATPASGHCELIATFARAESPGTSEAASAPTDRVEEAAPAAASPATRGAAGEPRTTRVLLVEDSAEVSRAYREALTALGYPVSESRNAEEALRAAAMAMPDVAIIDIHLPGMNGYQLAQALRAQGGSALRLVMLSGMTLDDTLLELSRRAGFDECFDKAAGPRALDALMRRLC